MARVFVDTNVLFPFCDGSAPRPDRGRRARGHLDGRSPGRVGEVIVGSYRRSAESAAAVTAAIRVFFSESKVEREDYQHLIEVMPGEDPEVRILLAGQSR
jgi:hypothetical protein